MKIPCAPCPIFPSGNLLQKIYKITTRLLYFVSSLPILCISPSLNCIHLCMYLILYHVITWLCIFNPFSWKHTLASIMWLMPKCLKCISESKFSLYTAVLLNEWFLCLQYSVLTSWCYLILLTALEIGSIVTIWLWKESTWRLNPLFTLSQPICGLGRSWI